jgi:membrane-associated protease RseP (regulator of RpoE activity)
MNLAPPLPSLAAWIKHIAFLLITFATMTIAGSIFPFGPNDPFPATDPGSVGEFFQFYASMIVGSVANLFTNPAHLEYGLKFSLSLIFILLSHEIGHYLACRVYKVDATLPLFIPTPPLIGPAGTFGAFIKILAPMPSRRAVFDIGVAGPLSGFIALIPIAILGVASMNPATAVSAPPEGSIVFTDPLFMQLIAAFFGINLQFAAGNAFYFAAWVGLLVTALNLIPSGQLDGGHAVYAVFGERVHRWMGRVAFVVMATLSVIGAYYFSSPSGFLIAIILLVMMRVKHPQPADLGPLGAGRILIAVATLLVFILSFSPFPIRIT